MRDCIEVPGVPQEVPYRAQGRNMLFNIEKRNIEIFMGWLFPCLDLRTSWVLRGQDVVDSCVKTYNVQEFVVSEIQL